MHNVMTFTRASAIIAMLGATMAWGAMTDGHAPATPRAFASFGHRPSHNHRYHATIVSVSTLAVGQRQRWILSLTARNHSGVAGARIVAEAWMPETDLRSPVRPHASYIGNGQYLIDDVYPTRPGWWNLALIIEGAAGADSVAFNVRVGN